jgi:hypothetical protein
MKKEKIELITLSLNKMGNTKEWFLVMKNDFCEERQWLITDKEKETVDKVLTLLNNPSNPYN